MNLISRSPVCHNIYQTKCIFKQFNILMKFSNLPRYTFFLVPRPPNRGLSAEHTACILFIFILQLFIFILQLFIFIYNNLSSSYKYLSLFYNYLFVNISIYFLPSFWSLDLQIEACPRRPGTDRNHPAYSLHILRTGGF